MTMTEPFDPYRKWLGIPPSQQPPHHYRLLGIEVFEDDAEVIDTAASQRMSYLQEVGGGPHVKESQRLLNEVSSARRCLLDKQKKAEYDAGLKAKIAKESPPKAAPKPPPVHKASRVEDDEDTVTVKITDLGISTAGKRKPAATAKTADVSKTPAADANPRPPAAPRRKNPYPVLIGVAVGVVAIGGVLVYVLGKRAGETAKFAEQDVVYDAAELTPQAAVRPREKPASRSVAALPAVPSPVATQRTSTPKAAPTAVPSPTFTSPEPTFFVAATTPPTAIASATAEKPSPTPSPTGSKPSTPETPADAPPPASFFSLENDAISPSTGAHFSPQGQKIHELCGAFRIGDEYHLFYDAYSKVAKSDVWGHAVSRDLFSWKGAEPIVLPVDVKLQPMLGSVLVDRDNASDLGKADSPPWLAAYTYTASGDARKGVDLGLAASTDGGKTWTPFSDKSLLRIAEPTARRPRIFYHAPSKQWSLCLFVKAEFPPAMSSSQARRAAAAGTPPQPGKTTYRLYTSPDLKTWTQQKEFEFKDSTAPASLVEVFDSAEPTKSQFLFLNGRGRFWFAKFDDAQFTTEFKQADLQLGGGYHGVLAVDDRERTKGLVLLSLLSAAGGDAGWSDGAALAFPRRLVLQGESYRIGRDALPGAWLEAVKKLPSNELTADASVTINDGGNQFQFHLEADVDPTAEFRAVLCGVPVRFNAAEKLLLIPGRLRVPLPSSHVIIDGTVDDHVVELSINGQLAGFDAPTGPDSKIPFAVTSIGGNSRVTSLSVTPLNPQKSAATAKAAK